MKAIFSFVIFFLLSSLYLFPSSPVFDSLEAHRVTSNYNGAAFNSGTILVYGDGGIVVRSTDGGTNWMQTELNDTYNILSVVIVGNDFYGVTQNGYIISSKDNGEHWASSQPDGVTEFYKIGTRDDKLYCRTRSKILVFDLDLNQIGEIAAATDGDVYDLVINGDKLYYSAGKGKIGTVDLTNNSSSTIDLGSLGVCSNCSAVTKMTSSGNSVYFVMDNSIYLIGGSSATKVYQDSAYFAYNTYDNIAYKLNAATNGYNIDSVYFYKINNITQELKRINKSQNDRYLSYISLRAIAFKDKDTIVVIGSNKLIYLSYDGGVNWELKSQYNIVHDIGPLFLFDKKNACKITSYAKFIKTNNGGTTWLPPKNFDDYFANDRFYDLYNFSVSYFQDKDNGYLFNYAYIQKDTNFIVTNDNCEHVRAKNTNGIIGYLWNIGASITHVYDKNVLIQPAGLQNWDFSMVFILNDSVDLIHKTYIDSTLALFADNVGNNKLIAIALSDRYEDKGSHFIVLSSIDTGLTWQKENSITLDFAPQYINLTRFNRIGDNIFIYSQALDPNDSSQIFRIDKYNIIGHSIHKVYENKNAPLSWSVSGYNNRHFLFYVENIKGQGLKYHLLLNTDIENNPTNWTEITPTSRYSSLSITTPSDSLFYITAYDSLFKSWVQWFAYPNLKTGVEAETEIQNTIYLSDPSPNPAENYVKIRASFDLSMNFDMADISVYDMLGVRISNPSQITFSPVNAHSSDIMISTNNYAPGVYFLNLTLSGWSRSVPFVVER